MVCSATERLPAIGISNRRVADKTNLFNEDLNVQAWRAWTAHRNRCARNDFDTVTGAVSLRRSAGARNRAAHA